MIINAMPEGTVVKLVTGEDSGLIIKGNNIIPQIDWDEDVIFVLDGGGSITS